MDTSYLLTPLLAWLVAGSSKFIINSIRQRRLAFQLIGYGGLPSNHSAIMSSMTALIALNQGINEPAFGVSLTVSMIVILDAHSLRRQIGEHATRINCYLDPSASKHLPRLRERIGHTPLEILTGILVGIAVGYGMHLSLLYRA